MQDYFMQINIIKCGYFTSKYCENGIRVSNQFEPIFHFLTMSSGLVSHQLNLF